MKNLVKILFAGALVATAAFAQLNDNGANARFHMKTGRDVPGVTAQSQAPAQCCGMTECRMNAVQTTAARSDAEQRFHAKTGRYQTAETAPVAFASAAPASTDAADRLRAKTGRTAVDSTVQLASAATAGCAMMGCCKHTS